jgi:hypothetical protein
MKNNKEKWRNYIIASIIGVIGYVLLFILCGPKIGTTVLIINWFINYERNNYINNILDKLGEELDNREKS